MTMSSRPRLFFKTSGYGIRLCLGIPVRFPRAPRLRHCQYTPKDLVITRFLHPIISSLFSTVHDLFGLRYGALGDLWCKVLADQRATGLRVIEWE